MKGASEPHSRNVQRASVQRAQQAGKRQAAAGARRAVGDYDDASAPRDRYAEDDVSIHTTHSLRRSIALIILVVALVSIGYAVIRNAGGWQQFRLENIPIFAAQGTHAALADVKRIGIVSGHRGNDSGSVCLDGLTEAQLNFDTAVRVAELLRAQGYTVDILNEFDDRLKGYQALLLLSIHADSCTYINDLATGFKVARVLDSKMPQEDDRLVSCLTTRYKAATGLRFHANTVTKDMTEYHAFNEINAQTPAAIIETGFMYLDRQVLTQRSDAVAQGIYEGLQCFLNHTDPTATPQ